MRGGVLQLARWGVLDAVIAAGTPAVRITTFHYDDDALPVAIKPRDGIDALYAPRRTVLDPILVDAARRAGAEILHDVHATDLLRDTSGRVCGVVLADRVGTRLPIRAEHVIGADGLRSTVAQLVCAPFVHRARHDAPAMYRLARGVPVEGYHWYYRRGIAGGTIPTNDGETIVFVTLPAERYGRERSGGLESLFNRGLAEVAPAIAEEAHGHWSGPTRAFAGHAGFMRRAHGPGWALVGDAGAFRDPITAHGITDALRDAEWLSDALLHGTDRALEEFEAARDATVLPLLDVTDAVASFDWELDQVRELHRAFSRAMARELDTMRERAPAATDAPAP
jgi:flavin-dependent dehydrogenase